MIRLFFPIIFAVGDTGQISCGNNQVCDTSLPRIGASSAQLSQILTIVFTTFGALAVLMIVIGGLRFVSAQGNPSEIAKARQTILYALIGLVLAISAQIIVGFVIGKT